MVLPSGALLGAYRIVAPLGAGGMGEVYRAHDSRLNREVAIKILRPEFADDAERLQRFVREAQTLAALNHPHIAQIHGIEDAALADGSQQSARALVMEFVEGVDLADRIARGPLPLDEALDVARQIAQGLEAAHEQGVVHRDLKPANIKLRRDGTVKLLDFGLARLTVAGKAGNTNESPGPGFNPANSPTMATGMTAAGVILGTAAYMSPEQARGKPVDKRADIWAFGVVLYEMLTGRSAYVGETVTDLLAAVVTRDPDWSALPPAVPPSIERLLRRCLERDPRTRLRDIGEARIAIAAVGTSADASGAIAAPPSTGAHASHRYWPWLAGAVLAIAAGVGAWFLKPAPMVPLRKLQLALPIDDNTFAAISPNGRGILFRNRADIVVTSLERSESRTITTSPPSQRNVVFWSPDSAFIAYNDADAKLWTIPAEGGTPRLICTIPETGQLMGATWDTRGLITVAVWRGSLYQVPATGGQPAPVATIDPQKEVDFHSVVAVPGGRVMVSTHIHGESADEYRVELIGDNRRETILGDGFLPVGFADGHALLHRFDVNPGLWAFPFSGQGPLRLEDGFLVAPTAGPASAATDGSLLYGLLSTAPRARELVWVDRNGKVTSPIGTEQLDLATPRLSADGRQVVFAARTGDNMDVWIHDLQSNTQTRVTSDATEQWSPDWFGSGKRIVYTEGNATAQSRIAVSNADGSGSRKELNVGVDATISPDGRYIVYHLDERGSYHLRYSTLSPDGTVGPPIPFLKQNPEPSIYGARFSPDGRYLAYVERFPGGRVEVFVASFPNGEDRRQISEGGGRGPIWTRSGELVFASGSIDGPKTIMAAPVTLGPPLTIGAPVKLFLAGQDLEVSPRGPSFDVTADGQRLVMLRSRRTAAAASATRWILVQNWLSEFKVQSPKFKVSY